MKIFKKHYFLLILLQIGFGFAQNSRSKPIIVIDPGHGGWDSGAVSENSIMEKNIVLAIAKEMLQLNQTIYEEKLDVYLTRYDDQFISLSKRARLSRALKADFFISLHCNASKVTSQGIEVYVQNSWKENSKIKRKSSIELANLITCHLQEKLHIKNRGLKFANFQVLRESVETSAGILLEIAFLSDSLEAQYLSKGSSIRAIALAIVTAINLYFKL